MASLIAPATLRYLLDEGSEHALVDVREHGEYNAAHISGASSLPRRLLEFRFQRLVPCRGVQVILCDDDGRRASLAAATISRMGYSRVAVLAGGLNNWVSSGFGTEWGMNVPSKDFGERIEVEHKVPTIEPAELRRRLQAGERITILDTRTPEEYAQFCIPGGRSLPGGELAYRVNEILKEQPDTTLVVNCAGRTRSIIGARLLQRMGHTDAVSLKNGTSGWVLAGLELEAGAARNDLPEPGPDTRADAEAFAARAAAEDGVRPLSLDETQAMLRDADQACTYFVDVRTEPEYLGAHIPGFWWCPGGQAVQRADNLVAVRSANIVFCCDGTVRSTVTASWFRQMGFSNIFVLQGGVSAWRAAGLPLERGSGDGPAFWLDEAAACVGIVSPAELSDMLAGSKKPVVLFVGTSRAFATGHVPGAMWLSRSWLELRIRSLVSDPSTKIIVTDDDGQSALLATASLAELRYESPHALAGGMAAWKAASLPIEQGLSGVMSPPDDVVPAGPERSHADMIQYLRWEEALGRKYESGH